MGTGIPCGFGPLGQESVLRDESGLAGHAGCIAYPTCAAESAAALRAAAEAQLPVTLQGARTGLCGGAVPFGGAVLCTARMNGFLAFGFDEEKRRGQITVQAGVTLEQVNRVLRSKSCDESLFSAESTAAWAAYRNSAVELEFLPNPTEDTATLGGIAACNASGARFCGGVAEHLAGFALALPDGRVLRHNCACAPCKNGESMANSGIFTGILERPYQSAHPQEAGYRTGRDIIDLLCTSEGTLGLICELVLELHAAPATRQGVWIPFGSIAEMGAFWHGFLQEAEALPTKPLQGAECFGSACFALLQNTPGGLPAALPCPGADGAVLLLELAALHDEDLFAALELVLKHLESLGIPADDVAVASDTNQLAAMTNFRHKVVETAMLAAAGAPYLAADACAPEGDFFVVFDRLAHMPAAWNCGGYLLGKPLAGTVSIRLWSGQAGTAAANEAYGSVMRALAETGCVCSGEYGVGRLKKALFAALSPARAKEAVDIRAASKLFAGQNPGVLAGAVQEEPE